MAHKTTNLNPECILDMVIGLPGGTRPPSKAVSCARLGGALMKRFFVLFVSSTLLFPLFILLGTVISSSTIAAQLTATWTEASIVDGFNVERATGKTGTFSKIATMKATSYTDTNLAVGTTFCYR